MSTQHLIEISLSGLDDEAALSVICLFDQWGRGGAVVEHLLDKDREFNVKTYLLPEDEASLRQIEIGLEILYQARTACPPRDSALREDPALREDLALQEDSAFSQDSAPTRQLPEPRIRFLTEADWAQAWKANYDVFRVGRRLVVKPTWCPYRPQPADLIIELDPGLAFGSGLHPTTRLCLEAMEDYLSPQAGVLDVGTGSGILAIAAARLGASFVLALDTDPLAVRVAQENVVLNQVQSVVQVQVGTLQISHTKKYQIPNLTVANILAETIIELAPALASTLSSEGILIASGIITDRKQAVVASLGEQGLSLVEERHDGDWVALIARKGTGVKRLKRTNDE